MKPQPQPPITVTGAFSRHTDGTYVEVTVDTRTAYHYLTNEDADALAVALTEAAETARRLSFDVGALIEEDAR